MKTLGKIILGTLAAVAVVVGIFAAANWAPDLPVSALAAKWAPPPSVFVDVAGMKVHLRDEGPRDDQTPIVLLHGTSSSLHTWDGWAEELKKTRRVVRFDMPGFGLTGPNPTGNYSIESYVAFMAAMLDSLGIRKCVLGGNSFGGRVAWETALVMPDRVAGLILVDSAGYPLHSVSVPIGFRIAQHPSLHMLIKNILPRRVIESSVRNVFGDPTKVTPELIDRYYDITRREGNRAALSARFKHAPAGMSSLRIPELRTPTLIMWGGRDRLIPPDNAQRFLRDIAGSQVTIFDELGHVPQEEDSKRTVVDVKKFLGMKYPKE